MRLEHYPLEKLKREIIEIIGAHLDLNQYRAFFFGSRVAGTGDEHSDIDVGIEGVEPVAFETMLEIQEELEHLPTLYKVQIVDFQRVNENFERVAKQHIELIK